MSRRRFSLELSRTVGARVLQPACTDGSTLTTLPARTREKPSVGHWPSMHGQRTEFFGGANNHALVLPNADLHTGDGALPHNSVGGAPHQERGWGWRERRQRAAPGADGGLLPTRAEVPRFGDAHGTDRLQFCNRMNLGFQRIRRAPSTNTLRAPSRASTVARCCTPPRARDVTSQLSSLFPSACPSSPPWGPSPSCPSGLVGPRSGSRRRRPSVRRQLQG